MILHSRSAGECVKGSCCRDDGDQIGLETVHGDPGRAPHEGSALGITGLLEDWRVEEVDLIGDDNEQTKGRASTLEALALYLRG